VENAGHKKVMENHFLYSVCTGHPVSRLE